MSSFTSFISSVDLRQTIPAGAEEASTAPGGQKGAPAAPAHILANQPNSPPPLSLTKFKIALSDSPLTFQMPLEAMLLKGGSNSRNVVNDADVEAGLEWLVRLGLTRGSGDDDDDVNAKGSFIVVKNRIATQTGGGDIRHVLISITDNNIVTLLQVLLQPLKHVNDKQFVDSYHHINKGCGDHFEGMMQTVVGVARAVYCDYCVAIAEMGPVVAIASNTTDSSSSTTTSAKTTSNEGHDDGSSSPANVKFLRDVMGVLAGGKVLPVGEDESVKSTSDWSGHTTSAAATLSTVTEQLTSALRRSDEEGTTTVSGMEDMDFWTPCVAASHLASSSLLLPIIKTTNNNVDGSTVAEEYLFEFLRFHAAFAKKILAYLADVNTIENVCKEAMKMCILLERGAAAANAVLDNESSSILLKALSQFAKNDLNINTQRAGVALHERVVSLGCSSQALLVDATLNAEDEISDGASVQPDDAISGGSSRRTYADIQDALLSSTSSSSSQSMLLRKVLVALEAIPFDDIKSEVQDALEAIYDSGDACDNDDAATIKSTIATAYKQWRCVLLGVPEEGALPEDIFTVCNDADEGALSRAEFSMTLPLTLPRLTTEMIPFLKALQQEQQLITSLTPAAKNISQQRFTFSRICAQLNNAISSGRIHREMCVGADQSAGFGHPAVSSSRFYQLITSSSGSTSTTTATGSSKEGAYTVGLLVDVDALYDQVCKEGDLSELSTITNMVSIIPSYWASFPAADTGLTALAFASQSIDGDTPTTVVVASAEIVLRTTLLGSDISASNVHLRNHVKCWTLLLAGLISHVEKKDDKAPATTHHHHTLSSFLPHTLSFGDVLSSTSKYLSFIIHHLALHCHVQQGAKVLFLEKCCGPSLSFASAPSSLSAPEILNFAMANPLGIVRRYLNTVSREQQDDNDDETPAATVNPYIDSHRRQVRLFHIQVLRRASLPLATVVDLRTTADAIRAGVRASVCADEEAQHQQRRTSAVSDTNVSTFEQISLQIKGDEAMKLFPFPTANRHVPFDSEDVDVKAATSTAKTAPGYQQRLLIGSVEASRKVISSLDGAWGTVGAIYGACASKTQVASTFTPFTTTTDDDDTKQAIIGSLDRRDSQSTSDPATTTTHHVAERFVRKLEYLLDHPSTVNYMLSGPDSHAAGFAELWTSRSVHIKEDKRYKTRCEMMYDAVMSPLIEATVMKRYEQLKKAEEAAVAASEELDDSAIFIKAVQQSKKVPDCLWVRLWYSFFLALRNNGGQRLQALAIINKGTSNEQAGDVVVVEDDDENEDSTAEKKPSTTTTTPPTTKNSNIIMSTENWNSLSKAETDALTTGLQEAAIALSNIVDELEEICPQLTGKTAATAATSDGSGGASVIEEEVTLESLFQSAQKAFGKVADKYSNDIKLRFYGLFKQATVGDINTKRPWGFDMAGKAKWDAWSKEKGLSTEEAMRTYVEEWEKL